MPRRHSPGSSTTRVLAHVEEVILASSGEDAFELVLAVAAARLLEPGARHARAGRGKLQRDSGVTVGALDRSSIARVARAYRALDLRVPDADPALLARVDGLLDRVLPASRAGGELEALDAVFESLVSRVAKGHKGQFFTPRRVIASVVRVLRPRRRELVVDPACGSGAFLGQASRAGARTWGSDVDARAVRVARLFALASGRAAEDVVRADGLRGRAPVADVVATNPPFAGRAPADGFEVAGLVRAPERDVLFLERSLDLLRPGGRLGIVLPYNKASGEAFEGIRRWLALRARVFAVVGLPRETFLPHTSQRTFVLFAKKRKKVLATAPDEEGIAFVVSERAGKDRAGVPVFRDGKPDDDLDDVEEALVPFLEREGFYA